MSTIAAIATPHAAGGIAVIRISGENALAIADHVFQTFNGKLPSQMSGYTCAYGRIAHLDDGILTVFHAPHSYTGEDTAELSCHGGIYVTQQILNAVYQAGAVPAEPGEFTKRAFLNGKLSLTQAEAVMDVISADNARELQFAESMRSGAMVRRVQGVQERLVGVLSGLAAWADYPEEDLPEVAPERLQSDLQAIETDLQQLLSTKDYGRILKSGVSTVIAGKPNVGKSTLFNLLSGCERSIVTEIAGTTRDVVEECVRLGEVTLRLSDTAGLRETADIIEQIGVKIARERLEQADLLLAVFDCQQECSAEDRALLEQAGEKPCIVILNKSDNGAAHPSWMEQMEQYECILMSAKQGSGLSELQAAVEQRFYRGEVTPELGVLANARQVQCAETALEMVKAAETALEDGELLDAVTVLLEEALQALLLLTGERATEAVVEEVFRKFCVGK